MKRIGNIYDQICSIENLHIADKMARKNKGGRGDILWHDLNREYNISALKDQLINQTYRTSSYKVFKIYAPKEREVYKLPYYPDHIAQHAVMLQVEPVIKSMFTADNYSYNLHKGIAALKKTLKDKEATRYCCKIDIRKFYPNINHHVLKNLLRHKFKDMKLLWLLDEIIDSSPGLPIGNYPSIILSNFYLTYFDHWIKKNYSVKYFRYVDDMVFLSGSKAYLHELLSNVRFYLNYYLKLSLKRNYQIFPVDSRGIDFLGYNTNHCRTLIRKNTKKRFARMIKYNKNKPSIASYTGWLKHCDSKHLLQKLLPSG